MLKQAVHFNYVQRHQVGQAVQVLYPEEGSMIGIASLQRVAWGLCISVLLSGCVAPAAPAASGSAQAGAAAGPPRVTVLLYDRNDEHKKPLVDGLQALAQEMDVEIEPTFVGSNDYLAKLEVMSA